MLHEVKSENEVYEAVDGVLAGVKFREIVSRGTLPVAGSKISTMREALVYQDFLDTTYDFRAFVKECLRDYSKKNGIKATLELTGLSQMGYYRGMKAHHQRFDSAFNKYIRSLKAIEIVFNELHNARARGINHENQCRYF